MPYANACCPHGAYVESVDFMLCSCDGTEFHTYCHTSHQHCYFALNGPDGPVRKECEPRERYQNAKHSHACKHGCEDTRHGQ